MFNLNCSKDRSSRDRGLQGSNGSRHGLESGSLLPDNLTRRAESCGMNPTTLERDRDENKHIMTGCLGTK